MGRWLIIALGLVGLLSTQALAQSPSMQISYSVSKADYDPDHPGMESRVVYEILNTSPLGAINNMINFTLPTGLNAGADDVILGDGMSGSPTGFVPAPPSWMGTGLALEPGQPAGLNSYSTRLTTRLAYATAEALWGRRLGADLRSRRAGGGVPMELVPPGPAAGERERREQPGEPWADGSVDQLPLHGEAGPGFDELGGRDSFSSPGSGTNWTATATNAPTQFYRVRTP